MAPFILAEKAASLERCFPTSAQLWALSHHGLPQVVSSDDLGNRRAGLTPPPRRADGLCLIPQVGQTRKGQRKMLQAGPAHNELVCTSAGEQAWRAVPAAVPCPASTGLLECTQLCAEPLAHCTIYWGYNIIAMQNSLFFFFFFFSKWK